MKTKSTIPGILLLLLIIGIFFNACERQRKVKFEPHKAHYSTSELISKLDSAYQHQDSSELIDFFNNWVLDIKPNKKQYVAQNKIIESVYNIYRTFYIPNAPFKLGDWEAFHIPRDSLKYFVIQNKVFYSVLPDNDFEKFNWKTHKIDSINNFKPELEHLGPNRILYLASEYRNALNGFLGSKYKELGTNNLMTPSLPEGESEERYKFLKKYIHILHGHWGGYWHLETHPEVGVIIMNNELTKAKVHFRYGYQGGETVLEKENDDWMIKSSQATWIE